MPPAQPQEAETTPSLSPSSPLSSLSPLHSAQRRVDKLNAILEVAKAMAAQHTLDTLLPLIMNEAAQVLEADRCSLFILDRQRGELWSRVAQGVKGEIRVPLGQGVVGTVAQTGQSINLLDAYEDPRFQRDWDTRNDYRTKSVLCVPMHDTGGDVVGVLQALNASDGAFDGEDEEMLLALGGQAAQAIENVMLHEEISRLFEGFVQASVMAIESRDPTTAGHSGRVASLTVELAKAIERTPQGPYRALSFTDEQIQEIRYASLLHDFGKIGVREPVLVKADKLYPAELEVVKHRFELAKKDRKLASMTRRVAAVRVRGDRELDAIEEEENQRLAKDLEELDGALELVLQCNRPTVLAQGGFERLYAVGALGFFDSADRAVQLLSDAEVQVLSIPKGSLSIAERREIESHVTHTFRFLSEIPWTRALKRVPEIAYAHHERLDGKGYPRSVGKDVIPVQSKMMAISDIYDALTASDRPYKKALPQHMALDILKKEAEEGQIDGELFRIFVEAEVPRAAIKQT